MKNKIKIFICIFSLISTLFVSSCGSKNKIIIDSTYKISESIDINNEQLSNKLDSKDNFILYIYTNGCMSCESFEKILNVYIQTYSIDIYKINYVDIEGLIETNSKMETNPRIIIFNQGKIYKQENIYTNSSIFSNSSQLKAFLSKYIITSNMVKINYSDIDELKNSNSVIYYGWSKCGDCIFLENNTLKNYINPKKYNTFYYYDCDPQRQYKDADSLIWPLFLERTLININDNGGKVPTIIKYENNALLDYTIYMNDELEYSEDGKIKIINTSYNDNGNIIGNIYNSYSEYQKGVKSYHDKKLNEFFNKYLLK